MITKSLIAPKATLHTTDFRLSYINFENVSKKSPYIEVKQVKNKVILFIALRYSNYKI